MVSSNPNPPLPKIRKQTPPNPLFAAKGFRIYAAAASKMAPAPIPRRPVAADALARRKPLADVSNASRSYPLVTNRKPIGKGNAVLQGNGSGASASATNIQNRRVSLGKGALAPSKENRRVSLGKGSLAPSKENRRVSLGKGALAPNKENRRISLSKGVVVASASLRKSIGGKVKGKENNMGRSDSSVGTGRQAISVNCNMNNEKSCLLKNRLSNNTKIMKDKLDGSNPLPGKSNIEKNPPRLRVSLTRGVTVSNASSIKPSRIIPQNRRISIIKRTSTSNKPATINSSKNKEVEVPDRSSCNVNASVPHQGCGLEKVQVVDSCSSNENVTAIISRPKCRRRKSYTSSLIAGTKIMGEHADFIKKDELPYIDDSTNPLEVAEYVDDIYQYYWTMEVLNPSLANYMTIQSEITPRMRGIMINWLIEVHFKFDLMQETLFLMVELLDRILSIVPIKKNNLQNLGLTTLLLASKYEDFWHPKIDELISISVNAFTREEMLAMEKVVLTQLRYRLNIPTPYVFMLRFLKASQSDQKLEHLAFYLIELCLPEYEALQFKPSLLCASAIYVARCTLNVIPAWTALLSKHARYEESQLRVSAELILRLQRGTGLQPTNTTYEKFRRPARGCVASIEPLAKLPFRSEF